MITIGEQTGRLEEMVDKVADWFEFELDEKIKRLTSILEPVLIVFVGGWWPSSYSPYSCP